MSGKWSGWINPRLESLMCVDRLLVMRITLAKALCASLCLVLLAAKTQAAEPVLPRIPERSFLVTDYGAKGDAKTKNTQSIASAIATAEKAAGGTVKFPAGTYLTGAIALRSSVGLQLEKGATLLFSTDLADYPVVLT